jgi:hypothetical protein
MNSWKLGTFFIFSLMLFASVCSNTVLAADGAGTAVVNWGQPIGDLFRTLVGDINKEELANNPERAPGHLPLEAGTRWNRIKIIYTAAADDNMGGGSVRVKLPGWAIPQISGDSTHKNRHGLASKNRYEHVLITSQPTGASSSTILYETSETELSDNVTQDNLAMVQTISQDMVEVKLSDDWQRGGTLRIRFGSISSGVPTHLPFLQEMADIVSQPPTSNIGYYRYASYQLTVSSRTKNGVLVRLKKQPSVRVMNIARVERLDTNLLKREFTVKPATVYEGEEGRDFRITFTAPGPMYVIDTPWLLTDPDDAFNPYPVDEAGLADPEYPRIVINIPEFMRPAATDTIDVSRIPGVVKFKTHLNTAENRIARIEVFLDGLNQGQTVTVRYKADITTDSTKVCTILM